MIFDLTIIGAGIVGLSTAFNYSKKFPKSKILVVEKESTEKNVAEVEKEIQEPLEDKSLELKKE